MRRKLTPKEMRQKKRADAVYAAKAKAKAAAGAPAVKKRTTHYIDHSTGFTFGTRKRLALARKDTKPSTTKKAFLRLINDSRNRVAKEHFPKDVFANVLISKAARRLLALEIEHDLHTVFTVARSYTKVSKKRGLHESHMLAAIRQLTQLPIDCA
jgi:hypothetical protein